MCCEAGNRPLQPNLKRVHDEQLARHRPKVILQRHEAVRCEENSEVIERGWIEQARDGNRLGRELPLLKLQPAKLGPKPSFDLKVVFLVEKEKRG